MPRYLFSYLELFSFMGDGTPQNPGGDFSMHCWIEATTAEEALKWGHVLLGDYHQKRFAHCDYGEGYDGSPIIDGEIETDEEILASFARKYVFPECKVGEIPVWEAPWRTSNGKDAS